MGPFADAAGSVRDWIGGLFSDDATKGEIANDYEPVGPGDTRYNEIQATAAQVATQAIAAQQRAILDQAIAEQKARNTGLIIAGVVVGYLLLSPSSKRSRRRR